MKIKMLASLAGPAYALSIGDETDRFDDPEAGRLIKAGFAEKAPPVIVKKPNTKAEWDDERTKLLDEHAKALAELEALKSSHAVLSSQIDDLAAFKASVVVALGSTIETTDSAPAAEVRG